MIIQLLNIMKIYKLEKQKMNEIIVQYLKNNNRSCYFKLYNSKNFKFFINYKRKQLNKFYEKLYLSKYFNR
jgi:hypothetical protein